MHTEKGKEGEREKERREGKRETERGRDGEKGRERWRNGEGERERRGERERLTRTLDAITHKVMLKNTKGINPGITLLGERLLHAPT